MTSFRTLGKIGAIPPIITPVNQLEYLLPLFKNVGVSSPEKVFFNYDT